MKKVSVVCLNLAILTVCFAFCLDVVKMNFDIFLLKLSNGSIKRCDCRIYDMTVMRSYIDIDTMRYTVIIAHNR